MFNFAQGQERRSRHGGINRRNTLSILRIALKLHCVPKFEPDAGIGQKGAFCEGLPKLSERDGDSWAGGIKKWQSLP